MKYTTVEELLLSDSFLKWYQQTDEKEAQVWDKWIADSPEHQRLVDEAIQILKFINSEEKNNIKEDEITEAVNNLKDAIWKTNPTIPKPVKSLRTD